MNNKERQQTRYRAMVEASILERDVIEGVKYQEALKELEEAINKGYPEPALSLIRLKIALYAPAYKTKGK